MKSKYRIASALGFYANKWIVIRMEDMRIMTESRHIKECISWVETWGNDPNLRKKGTPLSPNFPLVQ